MYKAPVVEIAHTIVNVAGMNAAFRAGQFGDFSDELLGAILEEAGRLAGEEIEPIAVAAEKIGARYSDGVVTMPAGFKEAYKAFCAGGWSVVSGAQEYGGQGLPTTVSMAALEIWNCCSVAFGLCATLNTGATEAIETHASQALKSLYLPKMYTGEWTGTMNLTEPHAGTDVGAIRTRAEPNNDGTYRIYGQKIYITYGEHDLNQNIVHLVLARIVGAPSGTKGISLFLVPKFLPDTNGNPGKRNDVYCGSIEHKMGIHASPTCVMLYGDGKSTDVEAGAIGWLVGEENRGLACMFTMMNNARLAVGMQGVSVAEGATQKAIAFAKDRRQGRAVGSTEVDMSPIIEHPDVKRMLMTMKALTQVARAICYSCAMALDNMKTADAQAKNFWAERAAFLTPLAKSFATDIAMEVASHGVQVHGGMGFIEDTGAARFMRDARILPIYEGTNGVQAIDLVTRKLSLGEGNHAQEFILELRGIAESVRHSNLPGFGTTAARIDAALDDALGATDYLQAELLSGRTNNALAGATPYQRLLSLAAGGAYLAKGALAGGDASRIGLCRYFAENLIAETGSLKSSVLNGAASLLEASEIVLN